MKKIIKFIPLLTTPLLLSGCFGIKIPFPFFPTSTTSSETTSGDTTSQGGNTSQGGTTSTTPGSKAAWTIMIYLCGSDLESGYDGSSTNPNSAGLGTTDISEILAVNGQPDDVNIIIETGGARAWKSTYGISNSKLGRYHVRNKKLVKDAELNNAAMGAEATFESFLKWGLTEYPAEKTGVILWNHGGGMRGVCYDETTIGKDDPLLNSETTKAFKNVIGNNKLEFVGYDACLMSVQDIAEANSNYFNYMVAAQESEAGEGWAYDTWIDDIYQKKDTKTILKAICDGFIESYEKTYGSYYDNDQTLSYLDLSKMSAYKTAIENIADEVGSGIKAYGTDKFYKYMRQNAKNFGTQIMDKDGLEDYGYSTSSSSSYYYGNYGVDYIGGYYYDWGGNYFGGYDVVDFFDKASTLTGFSFTASKVTAVKNALKELVVYNAIGDEAGASNGLCLYFPTNKYAEKSTYYSTSETTFTKWRSMVNSYGA